MWKVEEIKEPQKRYPHRRELALLGGGYGAPLQDYALEAAEGLPALRDDASKDRRIDIRHASLLVDDIPPRFYDPGK